ncbi:MAG: galactose mutarotase [Prevotella sp.]|nr:galactose mutarotase [Prevotella sp.]
MTKKTFAILILTLLFCVPMAAQTLSGLSPEAFVTDVNGKKTALYTITNQRGMEACITNYGARLVSLMAPGRYEMEDVVLGFNNINDYISLKQNFGATVGRYIGRIKGARFVLDGKEYQLQGFGKGNISHGGKPGFANVVWDMVFKTDSSLTLRYLSPDGEAGFPGNLTVTLTYTLTSENALKLNYEATTDKPTVLNISNHSFFNISGNPQKDILHEKLTVNSKKIATFDAQKNLDGGFRKVKGTPFDFRKPKAIGQDIDKDDEQLTITTGYDHSFILKTRKGKPQLQATLTDQEAGRQMLVYTTEPALHIYTANGLKGNQNGKLGIAYPRRSAICFEAMHLADSPNHPEFPSTVLRPGETWRSITIYQFATWTRPQTVCLTGAVTAYGLGIGLAGLLVAGIVSLIK